MEESPGNPKTRRAKIPPPSIGHMRCDFTSPAIGTRTVQMNEASDEKQQKIYSRGKRCRLCITTTILVAGLTFVIGVWMVSEPSQIKRRIVIPSTQTATETDRNLPRQTLPLTETDRNLPQLSKGNRAEANNGGSDGQLQAWSRDFLLPLEGESSHLGTRKQSTQRVGQVLDAN